MLEILIMARPKCGSWERVVAAGWRARFTEKEKVKCMRGRASRKVIKVGNEIIKNYDNGVGEKDS